MTKRVTRYHTLRTPQGNATKKVTAKQNLRRQLEETLMDMESNRHGVSLRLISLQDGSFIYEKTWEGVTRKYRVPLVLWESGQRIPNFASQELINDQQTNSILANAITNYANNSMKGENTMSDKIQPLVNPGVIETYDHNSKEPLIPPIVERKSWEYPGADRRKDDKQKPEKKNDEWQGPGVEPLLPILE
jgi:hypothetical protein